MYQKVIVIGSPGAGKSTFSRKLRDVTGLPLYYLDMLWHKPDKTTISKQEFDIKLKDILIRDKWIIDGNYNRTIEMRLKYCDAVFLMDFPVDTCIFGAESRVGKQREDMPWCETELDSEFKQFIIDFPKEKLPRIYELIEKNREDKIVVVFKSREESEEYLRKFKQQLNA